MEMRSIGANALDVEPIAQAQWLEFVLAQLAREETACLVAKLRNTLVHQPLIDDVVAIHRARL